MRDSVLQIDLRKDSSIEEVMIHPVFNRAFLLTEHPEGELPYLGDALGCDCMVTKAANGWRLYEGKGTRNEDWYGWGADVLSPIDGVVESVYVNLVTNEVGRHFGERASSIVFLRDDAVRVMYGHVDAIEVQPGALVAAGQRVAKVGNNGTSWFPHIHIGAWKDDTPLQIRFDLRALGQLQSGDPDRYYYGR